MAAAFSGDGRHREPERPRFSPAPPVSPEEKSEIVEAVEEPDDVGDVGLGAAVLIPTPARFDDT